MAEVQLLHRDDDFVVVDKPSGLAVHRGWAADEDVLLCRVRDALGQEVWPVHRLDRGTSGAVLFARNPAVLTTLSRQFEAGTVAKSYLALVRGEPPASGVIDYPVPKTEGGERVAAVTRFVRLARSPVERCSLVEAHPQTGRFHQIRRHFKHLSHPLIGDVNYGSGEINRYYRARYAFGRLALHARSLAFYHPKTGRRLCIVAALPVELTTLLTALELPL